VLRDALRDVLPEKPLARLVVLPGLRTGARAESA
jgi:hypothetical protein